MDARSKRDALWQRLQEDPAQGEPGYADKNKLIDYGRSMDFSKLINHAEDTHAAGDEKVICSAGGAVAQVRFDWRPHARRSLTGLFRQADFGIIRCSSVTKPQAPSMWSPVPAMVPMVGLKFFRDGNGVPSGNAVLAHKKSGHKDNNFMAVAISNHFTENVQWPFSKVLEVFRKYSDFPTFSGLAEFAALSQDGQKEEKPCAPYCLVLVPPERLRKRTMGVTPSLADQLKDVGAGDVFYEAYAVMEPVETGRDGRAPTAVCTAAALAGCGETPALWRVGELRLETPFLSSLFGDRELFFKHELFDWDLQLRPDWRPRVDTLLGAPFYDKLIQLGDYWDPQEEPNKVITRAASQKNVSQSLEELAMEDEEGTKSLQSLEGFLEVAQREGPDPPACPFLEKGAPASAGMELSATLAGGPRSGAARAAPWAGCPFMRFCCSEADSVADSELVERLQAQVEMLTQHARETVKREQALEGRLREAEKSSNTSAMEKQQAIGKLSNAEARIRLEAPVHLPAH